ncbi:hypothetical protein LJR225_002626 [Phenylobacterium sp. LjRoot225]|uniref:PepSY domain-containing protein n=1 Tax=Phenylobacterium sp. LjRoot225 TaxID=3342285 RepID=UPI003ED0176F
MKRLLVIITLFAATAAPLAATAQDTGPPAPASGRQVSLSSVIASIKGRQPGRHLNTTMGQAGGRSAYIVQWQLPDGRVVIFIVDAESGQILSRQGG